jgi:hypothetical protein
MVEELPLEEGLYFSLQCCIRCLAEIKGMLAFSLTKEPERWIRGYSL